MVGLERAHEITETEAIPQRSVIFQTGKGRIKLRAGIYNPDGTRITPGQIVDRDVYGAMINRNLVPVVAEGGAMYPVPECSPEIRAYRLLAGAYYGQTPQKEAYKGACSAPVQFRKSPARFIW